MLCKSGEGVENFDTVGIRQDFPSLESKGFQDYQISQVDRDDGNLAVMLNMTGRFEDAIINLDPLTGPKAKLEEKKGYPIPPGFPYAWEYELGYSTGNEALPSALIIRDSFGTPIIPFLSEKFERSMFIFDNWHYTANEHIIEQEKPDIVIYVVMESLWQGLYDGLHL